VNPSNTRRVVVDTLLQLFSSSFFLGWGQSIFGFYFLLFAAVVVQWTISRTSVGLAAWVTFYFISRRSRSIFVCAVARPFENLVRRDLRRAPSHWITRYSLGILEHVEKNSANFMLQSSGNLGSCSRLAVAFEGCALLLSAFFPPSNLLIHSSADAIKNSLFFCPFFFANVLAHTHTHSRDRRESAAVNGRLPPFVCRDKSGWDRLRLKSELLWERSNLCASFFFLLVTQWQTVSTHKLDSFVTPRPLCYLCHAQEVRHRNMARNKEDKAKNCRYK
jgi:hypothetical protein